MTVDIVNLGDAALELDIHGKVGKQDFQRFVPEAERLIERSGKVGMIVNVADFEGYTPSAMWQDLKFDVKHYSDISRLAIVSDDPSQKWMATVSRPFTAAEVKFYQTRDLDIARQWVRGQC